MNKNLKKVISATAALAISASSAVALAASFPDVESTASYNKAVNELTALGVINGYEDGTFGPDKNVTRAEITKMIVTAMGDSVSAAADAAAGKDTAFSDVTASHWAAGYISVGTSSAAGNFINGMGNGTFAPSDNVTFAQAMKMLVCAIGYSTHAEGQGGWPNGYLNYGYTTGIADGVSGVSNDSQLTRAQVAQMIDNAIKAPVCIINGYENDAWGNPKPKLLVKDGTGEATGKDGYESLLTKNHTVYNVYGRVQATHKSDSAIETDKVKFSVEKADNWDGYEVIKGSSDIEDDINVQMYIGDSDADKYLLTYSEALIKKDRNDEFTILVITPYGANETVSFAADDFAEEKTSLTASKGTIYAYQNGSDTKTTSYKLDTAKIIDDDDEGLGGFYVNGKKIEVDDVDALQGLLDTYVEGNVSGTVSLIDAPAAGVSTTDGNYDYIMVTYYKTGTVDNVRISGDEYTIYFDEAEAGVGTITLDYGDDDYEYEILLGGVDGDPINAADLQENDVLSIAYDVIEGFADSFSYTILVSRDTADGKCRSIDKNEDPYEYLFDNGETYKLAHDNVSELENGLTYTLYLDVFGNIAKADEIASSKKLAILDNAYVANGDQNYVTLITADGSKASYLIKDDKDYDEYVAKVYKSGDSGEKNFVADRVVEYNLNSSNEFSVKNYLDRSDAKFVNDGDYKETTGRIGSIDVADGITNMIDLSDYYDADKYGTNDVESYEGSYRGDYAKMAVSSLTDGDSYTAYAYSRTSSDNIYQFVLVMDGTSGFNVNSSMAIYMSEATGTSPNGSDSTIIKAMVNGEQTELYMSDDNSTGMTEGTPFFYKLNSDDEIDDEDLRVVFNSSVSLGDGYDTFYGDAVSGSFKDVLNKDLLEGGAYPFSTWNKNSSIREDECMLVFGPIVEKKGSTVYIGAVDAEEGSQKIGFANADAEDYTLASDINVYKYDYSKRSKYRVELTSTGEVVKSNFGTDAYVDYNGETQRDKIYVDYNSDELMDTTSTYGQVNFAVAKIVDDEITEILVILPSTSKK